MSAHSRRASRVLRRLGEADPAFAALALWCRHEDAEAGPDAPPAWTSGNTILYGPGFEALPLHEQAGLAAHHLLHMAFRHGPRACALRLRLGADFDPFLFNLAADAIVNQTLVLAGHALPRPCPLLDELAAAAFGDEGDARAALARFDAETLYLGLASRNPDRAGRSGENAAASRPGDGPADRARAYAEASRFAEDLRPEPASGDAAAEGEEGEWRQRLLRALEAGRAAGSGLGALAPLLAELRPAPTPWERVLRRLVTRAATHAPRPAPSRPSRRWIARDADARARHAPPPPFEPGTARDATRPRIAACIDCSSSIDTARLERFAAEIAGIGRRTGAEIHVLAFDTEVRVQTRLDGRAWEAELRALPFARGGGTDFRPVLAASRALAPSIIVVLTDLDGPAGTPPGRIPVLWAVPADPAPEAPFGRILSLAR